MLGRFFDSGRLDPSRSVSRSEVKVERRSDPATDAALKRRIEHQIQEQLGDKVKSVEVRVMGKNVLVRAHATRFWQKRTVRHSLETLPSVASLHARVEVN